VSVVLGIQRAMRSCAILPSVASPTLQYFFKTRFSKKNIIEHEYLFDYRRNFRMKNLSFQEELREI